MNALTEQAGKDDAASFGKLNNGQLCLKHGLHFNPLLADGCGCCKEEEKHTQARIALWIVAAVLLAMLTVMARVTWHWGGTALANSSTIVQPVE